MQRARGVTPGPSLDRPAIVQTFLTFCACNPLGPCATSNSTLSPSARLRKPSAWNDPSHRSLGRAQTKTARQMVLAEAQTAGDGASYCLNRGQKYGTPQG